MVATTTPAARNKQHSSLNFSSQNKHKNMENGSLFTCMNILASASGSEPLTCVGIEYVGVQPRVGAPNLLVQWLHQPLKLCHTLGAQRIGGHHLQPVTPATSAAAYTWSHSPYSQICVSLKPAYHCNCHIIYRLGACAWSARVPAQTVQVQTCLLPGMVQVPNN
jgi:hypothetical protein